MKAALLILSLLSSTMAGAMNDTGAELQKRIQKITFPSVDLKDATLEEALAFLEQRSRELDGDPDPSARGVTFVVIPAAGDAGPSTKIGYSGKDVTLETVLSEIAASTDRDVYITSAGLVVCPDGVQPFPNPKEIKGEITGKL